MSTHPPHKNYCTEFVGLKIDTPRLDGSRHPYINFDNAASTPALKAAQDATGGFLSFYSSVHRGTGFKSQISTHIYEQARHIVMDFVGADPHTHTCIFGKNATEALNKLARRFPFTPQRNIVLTSGMEHHSNDLPWRRAAKTIHIALKPDGRLDEADFDTQLAQYGQRVALVAITGASNVTGFLNPIHRLAEKAHSVGAQIVVDCAQLAPHRKVDMRPPEDPTHLDYVTISAHKMYAPFGTGALVGRRDTFEQGDPDLVGGGTVEIVTLMDVVWAGPPDRDEAGSPNVVGAVALAAAIRKLESIGMDEVARHEAELTSYLLERLADVPDLEIYGDSDPAHASQRLGVVPINFKTLSHFLVAAILGHEFGIGVRNGCFCAHPYLLHLLGLSQEESDDVRSRILAGDRRDMPGLVRISFGLYNTREEIDALIQALQVIAGGGYQGTYLQDPASGEYSPQAWQPDFDSYFSL
jgi:cysteine desulfurase/selenocysteine lyase